MYLFLCHPHLFWEKRHRHVKLIKQCKYQVVSAPSDAIILETSSAWPPNSSTYSLLSPFALTGVHGLSSGLWLLVCQGMELPLLRARVGWSRETTGALNYLINFAYLCLVVRATLWRMTAWSIATTIDYIMFCFFKSRVVLIILFWFIL